MPRQYTYPDPISNTLGNRLVDLTLESEAQEQELKEQREKLAALTERKNVIVKQLNAALREVEGVMKLLDPDEIRRLADLIEGNNDNFDGLGELIMELNKRKRDKDTCPVCATSGSGSGSRDGALTEGASSHEPS